MKGRNPRLIQLRNEYLIKRFYYWHEMNHIRRDRTLEILSEKEVFLETFTIESILRDCYDLLKEIKRKKPTEKQLSDFVFTGFSDPVLVPGTLFN